MVGFSDLESELYQVIQYFEMFDQIQMSKFCGVLKTKIIASLNDPQNS